MKDVIQKGLSFGSVPLAALPIVWPDVKQMISGATDTSAGKFEAEDVRAGIERGELALWVVVDETKPIAALTTRVIMYPRRRALAIDWVGGTRMREWLPDVMRTFKQFAVDNGCSHLEGYGVRAWGRYLAKYGWKPEYTAYRMELIDDVKG